MRKTTQVWSGILLAVLSILLLTVILDITRSTKEEMPLILPRPRDIQSSGPRQFLPPGHLRLVVVTEHPMVRSGVDYIQQRLARLGQAPLPVLPESAAPATNGWTVMIGVADSPLFEPYGIKTNVPAEAQGYSIVCREMERGKGVIMLAGNDPVGALYACITFKRLLDVSGGRLTVMPAFIRDWPDYKYRLLDDLRSLITHQLVTNHKTASAVVAKAKTAIDREVVEYKANCVYLSPVWFQSNENRGGMDWSPIMDAAQSNRFDWIKEIIDYGHARGVYFVCLLSSGVAPVQGNEDNPRLNQLMRYRGMYFTWGDDELLRAHFKKLAKAFAHFDLDIIIFHHADTDSPYEKWNNRSEIDRRRFGDDRAKANVNLVTIYTEAFRQAKSNVQVYACLLPYMPSDLRTRNATEFQSFAQDVDRQTPPETGIMLREGNRAEYEKLHQYYGGRSLAVYHEPYHLMSEGGKPWCVDRPLLSCQWRLVKTFFFNHPRSLYYNPWSGGQLNRLLAAQYVWNVNSPGGADTFNYKESLSEYDGAADPNNAPLYREMLPMVIREVYGEAVLPELLEFYALPFRPAWLAFPSAVRRNHDYYLKNNDLKGCRAPDELEQMKIQIQAGEKGAAAMDRLLAKKDLPPDLREMAAGLRRYALIFKHLGPAQLKYLEAGRLIENDETQKALSVIQEGRQLLLAAKDVFIREKLEGTGWISCGFIDGQRVSSAWNNAYIEQVYQKRFDELEALVAVAGSSTDKVVPADVAAELARKPLHCAKTATPPILDGYLKEKVWANAEVATPFIKVGLNRKGNQLYPEAQTEVRFLYDTNGLYVGMQCQEPISDDLLAETKQRDDMAIFRDDIVELFFLPVAASNRYCHLVFNVGEQRADMMKVSSQKKTIIQWDPEWQLKVGITDEGWSAEAFLPWALFKFAGVSQLPMGGEQWKAFVGRSRRRMEYSGVRWGESFHDLPRYPELIFENNGRTNRSP